VLALAIWWVLAGSKHGPAQADVRPTLNAEQVAESQEPVVAAKKPGATPVSATTAAPVAAAPAPAVDPAAQARKEDAAPARSTRLKLELANDSWVEVYDSRGERLFYDVATAGSVQSVEGRAPLRVVLGNSSGVTVDVDGQRREIPSNATDGEGARFVVNRSGSLSRAR
jgi:cytoskeleton protein RodZ